MPHRETHGELRSTDSHSVLARSRNSIFKVSSVGLACKTPPASVHSLAYAIAINGDCRAYLY